MTITTHNGRLFDHHTHYEDESLKYLIADNFSLDKALRSRMWKRNTFLDQGREGACTGFGFSHVMALTPRRKIQTDTEARTAYLGAQTEDQWTGEDYEGSSVWGVMRWAHKQGIIKSYHWAKTVTEIAHGVSHRGPMEMGSVWTEGMFRPDSNGFLRPTGSKIGGHAYCIGGVDYDDHYFRIDNSWGPDWGDKGSAKISFEDLESLLLDNGEAALPLKVTK
jgi:hypothetical protein